MKKATKSATTPASPAPVPAKSKKAAPAAKVSKPAKPVAPAPVEAPKAKKPAVKKAAKTVEVPVAPVAAVVAAPVAKTPAPTTALTVISAQIDVGFGNTLYVRGEGPGLSWEKGVALDCLADDLWSLTVEGAERPLVFKFLLNDLSWSLGEDYVAAPGTTVSLMPAF